MKRAILSLAIAGGLVSGDCFAGSFPRLFTNGNNSENNLRKVEGTEAEKNSNQSKSKMIAVKMRAAAAISAAVTASSLMTKSRGGILKEGVNLMQLGLILPIAISFKNDIKQKNVAGVSAKFVGTMVGSEFIGFLFNPNTYHAGLGTRSFWNSIPKPLKIVLAYKLTSRGVKTCTGKELNLLSTSKWILNKRIVNRMLKWPAYGYAYGLEKIGLIEEDRSKEIGGFFDDHQSSLGDFLKNYSEQKVKNWTEAMIEKIQKKAFQKIQLLFSPEMSDILSIDIKDMSNRQEEESNTTSSNSLSNEAELLMNSKKDEHSTRQVSSESATSKNGFFSNISFF